VLHECGYDDVIELPDAQSALDTIAALEVADLPQVALFDDDLRGGDGIDLVRAVRDRDDDHHVAVVVLTAGAREGADGPVDSSGADDCVAKPFTRAALVHTLEQVSARRDF